MQGSHHTAALRIVVPLALAALLQMSRSQSQFVRTARHCCCLHPKASERAALRLRCRNTSETPLYVAAAFSYIVPFLSFGGLNYRKGYKQY